MEAPVDDARPDDLSWTGWQPARVDRLVTADPRRHQPMKGSPPVSIDRGCHQQREQVTFPM